MLSFFKNLFSRRTVKFGYDMYNFVNVLDSGSRGPQKSKELFSGIIKKVDFDKRLVVVTAKSAFENQRIDHIIHFDMIVTISRMSDGRLRMWINVED